jgi:hypothetical protein
VVIFNPKNAVWLLLSVFVFVVDQWTKQLITAHFEYREVLPIFSVGDGGFNLTLAHNYGASFSFLADQSGWQRWLFAGIASVVGVGLVVWLLSVCFFLSSSLFMPFRSSRADSPRLLESSGSFFEPNRRRTIASKIKRLPVLRSRSANCVNIISLYF